MPKSIFDDLVVPPVALLLGWTLLAIDPDAGTIEVQFEGKPEFANPRGFVQGGILAAMLDDTLGPALFASLGGEKFGTTIDLHTHFLRPVPLGRITTTGRVTRTGKSVAFMEGQLFDLEGRLAARATGSAFLTPFDR